MSSSPTPAATTPSAIRSKKLVVPKVWKRPHSTIYGKNVEFGSSLYSDKIGEINGRKFNSELPWTVRNSGSSSIAGGSSAGSSGLNHQGYLSNILVAPSRRSQQLLSDAGSMSSYVDLLESTNPNRYSKRYGGGDGSGSAGNRVAAGKRQPRIDFYDQYMDFSREIDHLHATSLLMREPQVTRKLFNHFLDFDYELGLFVPNRQSSQAAAASGSFSSTRGLLLSPQALLRSDETEGGAPHCHHYHHDNNSLDINDYRSKCSFVPLPTMTQQTAMLPKHHCQLTSSPYGQSNDGRKLSLSAINPHSYRPSLPNKTTTTHASDGEEFEFHDRSSPFYTDRWAGKTIRHFDSDLYSNASLFKSMIL